MNKRVCLYVKLIDSIYSTQLTISKNELRKTFNIIEEIVYGDEILNQLGYK